MIRVLARRFLYSPTILLPGALALLVVGFLLYKTPADAIWSALYQLTGVEILLLLLVNMLVFCTFAGRWWLFLHAQGYAIPYPTLLGYRLTTFSISYFTPGPHVGGEPYQVYATTRWHNVPHAQAIAAVSLDKLVDLLFSFSFLVAGLAILLQPASQQEMIVGQGLLTAMLMFVAPTLLLSSWFMQKHPITRLTRWLADVWGSVVVTVHQLRQRRGSTDGPGSATVQRWQDVVFASEEQAIWLCKRAPYTAVLAIGVTCLSWLGIIGEYWLLTSLLGLNLSLREAMYALLAARIAILLPMPAGLGALEASQIFALAGLGFGPASGIALSLVIRLRDVLLGMGGLLLVGHSLWQPGAGAPAEASGPIWDVAAQRALKPQIVQPGQPPQAQDK